MIPATPQQLPDDVDVLKAMIAAAHAEIAELKVINATADERIARLTSIVTMLQRVQYSTRSERLRHDPLDDEQMAFVFDEIETGIGEIKAGLAARDKNNLLRVLRGHARTSRHTWSASSRSSSPRCRPTTLAWKQSASARTSPSASM